MVKPEGDKIVFTAGQFAQYPAPNETPAYYCVNLIIRQASAYPGKNRDGAVVLCWQDAILGRLSLLLVL